jgi:hypothetical protein
MADSPASLEVGRQLSEDNRVAANVGSSTPSLGRHDVQNSGATCGQRNRPVASGVKARKLHAHPLGNVSAAFEAVLVGEIEMYAAINPATAGFLGGLGEAREAARHAGYGRIGRGCAGCESVVVAEFSREIAAAAPLKVEWPDVYSGNGGVTISGRQFGSATVSGLPSRSPRLIAVTGRQRS